MYWPIAILETNVGMCQIWVAPSVIPPWWGASNPVLGLLCKALHVALEDLSDDTKWHTTGKRVEKNLGKSWLIHHDTSILRANPDPECLQDAHQILFEIRTESTPQRNERRRNWSLISTGLVVFVLGFTFLDIVKQGFFGVPLLRSKITALLGVPRIISAESGVSSGFVLSQICGNQNRTQQHGRWSSFSGMTKNRQFSKHLAMVDSLGSQSHLKILTHGHTL